MCVCVYACACGFSVDLCVSVVVFVDMCVCACYVCTCMWKCPPNQQMQPVSLDACPEKLGSSPPPLEFPILVLERLAHTRLVPLDIAFQIGDVGLRYFLRAGACALFLLQVANLQLKMRDPALLLVVALRALLDGTSLRFDHGLERALLVGEDAHLRPCRPSQSARRAGGDHRVVARFGGGVGVCVCGHACIGCGVRCRGE